MQLYKENEDVFTDLGLSEENKMPKKSIVFKDAVWVEKEGDKDIYMYIHVSVQIISEIIHKKLLTACFQEK